MVSVAEGDYHSLAKWAGTQATVYLDTTVQPCMAGYVPPSLDSAAAAVNYRRRYRAEGRSLHEGETGDNGIKSSLVFPPEVRDDFIPRDRGNSEYACTGFQYVLLRSQFPNGGEGEGNIFKFTDPDGDLYRPNRRFCQIAISAYPEIYIVIDFDGFFQGTASKATSCENTEELQCDTSNRGMKNSGYYPSRSEHVPSSISPKSGTDRAPDAHVPSGCLTVSGIRSRRHPSKPVS
ncbi:hypothetical protein Bbelb_375470 [Branchiostoma belcheri]|nr:hypothetical protein Bbelb_375470 [Branchiostoma belcheri]